jgi:hypothetical protein
LEEEIERRKSEMGKEWKIRRNVGETEYFIGM